jgi:hypothetical protein
MRYTKEIDLKTSKHALNNSSEELAFKSSNASRFASKRHVIEHVNP